jgi:hypothetical protein
VIVDSSRLIARGGDGEDRGGVGVDGGGVGVDEWTERRIESGDEVPHGCRAAGKTRSCNNDLLLQPVLWDCACLPLRGVRIGREFLRWV